MRLSLLLLPFTLILAATVLAATVLAQPSPPASRAGTIYIHGHILTGDALTTPHPIYVDALAVDLGVVLGAGTDADILARFRTNTTRIVDLRGAFVMPGFNDAHVHLGEAGRIRLSVDLTGTPSLAEFQARVRTAATAAVPGAWLTGGGWDHTLWPGAVLPTRSDLDSVTAGHPAFFQRIDGHIAIANSAALSAANITSRTPDPKGGHFDRDPQGESTGIVREDPAMELIASHIPPPTPADRRRGLELALADAAAHGLTSVQDNSPWEDFQVLQQLETENKLPIRVTEWLPFDTPLPALVRMRSAQSDTDRMLRTGMLKGFMDGSLGSRTAAMLAPYSDDPKNSGLPRYDQARLNALAAERAAAGFQIGFHAIGDRAVEMALDAFAAAEAARSSAGLTGEPRFRIEHSQVLAPGDFARYKQEGVIASMQPNHLLTDMHWAPARLGPERTRGAYAWKSFLDAGVPLAFGTDYPVEPITPFRGLYAAITRRDEANTMSFHPEDALTIGQALYAYTQGSAYAEFAETWKGRLAHECVADFVLLDRDLLASTPEAVLGARVIATIVGGNLAYRSGKSKLPMTQLANPVQRQH